MTFSYAALVVGTGGNQCNGGGNGNINIPNVVNVTANFNNSVVTASNTVTIRVNQRNANDCSFIPSSQTFDEAISRGHLAAVGTSAYFMAQNITVNGTWVLTNSYVFAPGSTITMKAGAQIVVAPFANLVLNNTVVEGCQCMWHRILVAKQGQLTIRNNSRISDAQYAVEMESSSANLVNISNTTFANNFVGLYMPANPNAQTSPLSSGTFVNNIFRSASLIRPFLNLVPMPLDGGSTVSPIQNTKGLAGLYFADVSLFTNNRPNTFRDLTAGMVFFRVNNIRVDSVQFRDILTTTNYSSSIAFQGTAIRSQGNFSSANTYALNLGGTAASRTNSNTFRNCNNGIVAIATNLSANNQLMRDIIEYGIRTRLNNRCQINVSNNDIQAATYGVHMNFMNALNVNVGNNRIELNTGNLPSPTAGIYYADNQLQVGLNISSNTVTCASTNAQMGIYVQGNQKGNVVNNIINLNGAGNPLLFSSRAAVVGQNSSILMTCNRVNPNASPLNDNRTVSSVISFLSSNNAATFANNIVCNTMDNTYTGIQVEGAGNTSLRGNYIKNHMNGLWYTSTAVNTPNQNFAGNLFISNNLPLGGVEGRKDAPSSVGNFTYNFASPNGVDLFPNPFISTNPNWFTNSPLGGDFDCNTVNFCTPLLQRIANPNINNMDMSIANNTYTPISNWDLHTNKRGLYRKLRQDVSISQTMPIMQQFESTEQNTAVGKFDLVQIETETALTLSAADSAQSADCQNQIQVLSDSIRWVDSLYAADTARLYALQNQLAALIQQCDSVAQIVKIAQNNLLDNTALATNATVNPVLDHETAEKLVNEIYLNTLAKGIAEFDATQTQTLQLISAQCPDIVGMSVYQARAMYGVVANVDMLSKAGCYNTNNMETQLTTVTEKMVEANSVVLYPNPTNSAINLHLFGFENIETQISIINMLGEQVAEVQNNTQSIIQVNVHHLPAGTYICQIKGNNEVVLKKFIITK